MDDSSINSETVFDVRDYGAVGDGDTRNTRAIKRAVEACAEDGGGTVFFPAGRYLTGTIELKSSITLFLAAGAEIIGSQKREEYPIICGRFEGVERETHAPLIFGENVRNVALTGRGTIDGRGQVWWDWLKKGELEYSRPRLVGFLNAENILLEDITLRNSPSWTVHPVYCENVNITGLTIINPPHSPNTDGINPSSCRNVRISNCYIDVGDDCIAIKSGQDEDGRRVGKPCENIAITNCNMLHGHGGVVIGSEMSGGVRKVTISNCIFTGTDRGIRLKTRRRRGGAVEDLRVTGIMMENVDCPFVINAYYQCGADPDDAFLFSEKPQPVSEGTPIIRDVYLSNITARGVNAAAGYFCGLPELPISRVFLDNIVIELAEDGKKGRPAMIYGLEPFSGEGFICRNVENIEFRNFQVETQKGPALRVESGSGLQIDNLKMSEPHPQSPVIRFDGVDGALISGCFPDSRADVFVEAGEDSDNIVMTGNHFEKSIQALKWS